MQSGNRLTAKGNLVISGNCTALATQISFANVKVELDAIVSKARDEAPVGATDDRQGEATVGAVKAYIKAHQVITRNIRLG